jgi:transcriptional regulator with XRE-family HTH domain
MTGGSQAVMQIPKEELLDEYYENLHGAYNAMREGFAASGLTQDHIAYALDVDKSLISRRLNGSENLTLKTLSHMGSAMGCRLTIKFVPYSHVGTGNFSFGGSPAATFSVTTTTLPRTVPGNFAKVLENN